MQNIQPKNQGPLCFVIMPFKKDFDPIYNAIKEICENEGFYCIRTDKIKKGMIIRNIFDNILNSKAIIADLTEKNPNVLYELGVAHTIARKTIMISQDKDLPFDISSGYVIFYDNTIEGYQILARELKKLLSYLLDGGIIDNPVQESIKLYI